jgi:hypothetical protein
MTESSGELDFVAIERSSLPHSHAVLIQTSRGWHVELEGVPADSCPLVRTECEITFATQDGELYAGTVMASFASDDAGYVLLTGVGELLRTAGADVN